jgi:hypothetical protein
MATRDEIVAAIQAVDARLETLKPRILAQGDAPLKEGTWKVREALSHLAARANGVGRVAGRVAAAKAGTPAPPPANIDDINADQVAERSTKSVVELLDEIATGHAAAIAAIGTIDQAVLDHPLPMGIRPGDIPASDMMLRGGPGHDNNHIDQIEAALS